MAFTRAYLRGMGIDEDKIGAIMEAHIEVTDALKKQRDDLKAEAEKYDAAKKELDELKSGDNFEAKYNALKTEFDSYKAERENEAMRAKKTNAYRDALKAAGIGDKYIDRVLKMTDIDGVTLDKDGRIKDPDKVGEAIKAEWGEFVSETKDVGENVQKPKTNTGGAMTRDQIMAITDRTARKEAIRNNPQAFIHGKE